MDKNTDKAPGATNPRVRESGWWAFLFVWVKTIALTVGIVLILKYIFKVPLAF